MPNDPVQQTTNRKMHQDAVLDVLHRWRREGALWTSDIAHGARLTTRLTRDALRALEDGGKVRRVMVGNPTSWELVDG